MDTRYYNHIKYETRKKYITLLRKKLSEKRYAACYNNDNIKVF